MADGKKEEGAAEKGAQLVQALRAARSDGEFDRMLQFLLTKSEYAAVADRWLVARVLLHDGITHREAANQAGVSITKVTRAAQAIEDHDVIVRRIYNRLQRKN